MTTTQSSKSGVSEAVGIGIFFYAILSLVALLIVWVTSFAAGGMGAFGSTGGPHSSYLPAVAITVFLLLCNMTSLTGLVSFDTIFRAGALGHLAALLSLAGIDEAGLVLAGVLLIYSIGWALIMRTLSKGSRHRPALMFLPTFVLFALSIVLASS